MIISKMIAKNKSTYWATLKDFFVLNNSRVNKDNKTIRPKTRAKLLQVPTRFPDETPCKSPGKIRSKPTTILNTSNITKINPATKREDIKYHNLFSVWK